MADTLERFNVLIVEDATALADAMSKMLVKSGFDVFHAHDGRYALELLSEQEIDLVLLDINIPKLNGFEVAKAIKELGYPMKIIAITARDSIEDKLNGFSLGFDDYMVKPFDMREMVARIRLALKNENARQDKCYEVRELQVNVSARSVKHKRDDIELTKIEFDIFEILLERSPAVVPNELIIEEVWREDPSVVDPPIRSHIKNLRKKIDDIDFSLIQTVPGVGYKIEESVECLDH